VSFTTEAPAGAEFMYTRDELCGRMSSTAYGVVKFADHAIGFFTIMLDV
jgi:hypothetical protein